MELFMNGLSLILKCVMLYITLTGLLFFLPRKQHPKAEPNTRFAVLIPARNEEAVIGATVKGLQQQNYPAERFDIFVIPNNCTDDTEAAARRAGAQILSCLGPVESKGDVLHQVFGQLLGRYDAYCVFDADNLVDPDFLARMNDARAAGVQVAKGRLLASNPYENWLTGAYDLYFQNTHLLFNLPRAALGLNAKFNGTGFMVTDEVMDRFGGWNTVTLTEDTEFGAQCAQRGVRIHYIPEAVSYDEQPSLFSVSVAQRRRWTGGVMTVSNRYCLRLLHGKFSWPKWDCGMFLSMIYVQLLAAVPAIYGYLQLPLGSMAYQLLVSAVLYWLGMCAMALVLAVTGGRDVRKMGKAILLYPMFMASWYCINIGCLIAKPRTWQPITHLGVGHKTPKALPGRGIAAIK